MTYAVREKGWTNLTLFGIIAISAFILFLIISLSFSGNNSNSRIMIAVVMLELTLFLFIPLQTFLRSTAIYYTSKEERVAVFKNFFTRKIKTYKFNELDGYVTGRFVGRTYYDKYKIIWIVKGGKMIERIDERYIKNYNELEEELKEMKYLGYQRIRNWKRFKMLFGYINID